MVSRIIRILAAVGVLASGVIVVVFANPYALVSFVLGAYALVRASYSGPTGLASKLLRLTAIVVAIGILFISMDDRLSTARVLNETGHRIENRDQHELRRRLQLLPIVQGCALVVLLALLLPSISTLELARGHSAPGRGESGWNPTPQSTGGVANTVVEKTRRQNQREGRVVGFTETRQKAVFPPTEILVWTFRVERYHDGQRLPAVAVEMRGSRFSDFIRDGDMVRVPRKPRGGLWRTSNIHNLTTGVVVRTRTGRLLKLLVLLLIVVAVAALYVRSDHFRYSHLPPAEQERVKTARQEMEIDSKRIAADIRSGTEPKVLDSSDPWGRPYEFHSLGGGNFEIRSDGPDCQPMTPDDLYSVRADALTAAYRFFAR